MTPPPFLVFNLFESCSMKKAQKLGVEKILEGGKVIERAEDETHYIHTPTGQRLERTTTWISGGKKFEIPQVWAGCLPIGSMVDQIVRDFFVEGLDEMSTFMYLQNVRTQAYMQLIEDLKTFADELGAEWLVYADRVFLFSLTLGVAGEVDLLLVNQLTGEIWIVDMKTSRAGTKSFTKKYGKNEPTKLQKYTLQLNTYRFMAEEMSGLPVNRISILPIKVFYPPHGSSTSEAYFEPLFDVEICDPVKEREVLLEMQKR